jgi:hypothetical protein
MFDEGFGSSMAMKGCRLTYTLLRMFDEVLFDDVQ